MQMCVRGHVEANVRVWHNVGGIRANENKEYLAAMGSGYSALMLAAVITLPHFSVSSAMNFPNSADVIDIGSTPKPSSRGFMLGSAAKALTSLLSLSITSAGVFRGAPRPYHWFAS